MSKSSDRVNEVMQSVTDRIVEMLEEGAADPSLWSASWRGITRGLSGAANASTHKHYRGGNAFALAIEEMSGRHHGPWATYKQWEGLGAQVRKGERSTIILVPKTYTKVNETSGKEETKVYFGTASVFGADQVDGYDAPERGTLVPAEGWIAEVVEGAQVLVSPGQPACAKNGSVVYMPEREMFDDVEAWFGTFAHELVHWSGHEHRAGARDKSGTFGTPAYAAEELVAELGAAIAAGLVGMECEPRADHAHYLAHWLAACTGDKGAQRLWEVAKEASKAVDWLDRQRATVTAAPVQEELVLS